MAGKISEQAEQAKLDYLAGMKYQDIADKYNVSLSTVQSWKKRHKWQRNDVHMKPRICAHENIKDVHMENDMCTSTVPKKTGAPFGNQNAKGHGAPKGNRNSVGNRGGHGGPVGNKNSEKHGFFAKILPDDEETREIIASIEIKSPLEILWENIVLQYGIIARAQKLMFVRDQNDTTEYLKRQKETLGAQSKGWEKEYEIQFAWDKHATLLKAQSVAMKTLDGLLARYDELMRSELATEEQRARIEKLRAEVAKIKGDEDNEGDDAEDTFLDALKGKVPEVWDDHGA